MTYRVLIPKPVQKELDRLPRNVRQKVVDSILELRDNPRPQGCKKLHDRDAWRIRIGDYRVIYEILDKELVIVVVRAQHRKEVYR